MTYRSLGPLDPDTPSFDHSAPGKRNLVGMGHCREFVGKHISKLRRGDW